jgi:hypothetical protein
MHLVENEQKITKEEQKNITKEEQKKLRKYNIVLC